MPARPQLEPIPEEAHDDAWWRGFVWRQLVAHAAYQVRLLGWGTIEVNKRAEVADCLDRERAAGRIR